MGLFSLSFADIISSIVCKGNNILSHDVIISSLGIKKGDKFSELSINHIYERLMNSSFVGKFIDNIDFDFTSGKLSILVKEKFFIEKVTFENIPDSAKKMLYANNVLNCKKNRFVSEYQIKEDIFALRNICGSAYFAASFFTNASYNIEHLGNNHVHIKFYFIAGPANYLNRIKFIGNHSFSADNLIKIISSKDKPRYLATILSANTSNYDKSILFQDVKTIKQYYIQNGFCDAHIKEPYCIMQDDLNSVDVVICVSEGHRYKIGKIDLINNSIVPNSILNKIKKKYIHIKDHHNFSHIDVIADDIARYLTTKGYKYVKVDIEKNKKIGHIYDFNMSINNTNNILIGKINVYGNQNTKESLIRGVFGLRERFSYSESQEQRGIIKLKSCGLFDDVVVKRNFIDNQLVDIDVFVIEGKTLNMNLINIQFSSSGISLDTNFQEKNWLGWGNRLAFGLSLPQFSFTNTESIGALSFNNSLHRRGNKTKSIYMSVISPYMFGYDSSFIPSIKFKFSSFKNRYLASNIRSTFPNIDESEVNKLREKLFIRIPSISIGTRWVLTNNLSLMFGYKLKYDQLVLDTSSNEGQKTRLNDTANKFGMLLNQPLHKFSIAANYNSVDSEESPKQGICFDASLALKNAFTDFSKVVIRSQSHLYYSIFDGFLTFASNINFGCVAYTKGGNLPEYDTFYINMPGFEHDSLNPYAYQSIDKKNQKVKIGGEVFWTMQNEVRFPIGPREMNLSGLIFISMGDVYSSKINGRRRLNLYEDIANDVVGTRVDCGCLRVSIGFGIRYPLPIGQNTVLKIGYVPSRLTFGDTRLGDKKESFYISLHDKF